MKNQLSSNGIMTLKVVSIFTTLIFPAILMVFLVGDSSIAVFHYTWIAFYSCVFVWLVHESLGLKIMLSLMNLLAVGFVTLLFLMSDATLIWKVIAKTILPFLPIPGLQ